MIKKKNRLIITFRTTTMAMSMESVCKSAGMPGRLIPVPKSITADCGMAWCADPGEKEGLQQLMTREGITYQEICLCMI